MALILDASGLYALANRREPQHHQIASLLASETELLVTSEAVVQEADYLILDRLGLDAEFAFLHDLADGTFVVECLSRAELGLARDLARQYRDLKLGLADASLVILARRYDTRRIMTLDQRAFRAVAPLQGGTFTLLPADA